MPNPPPSAFLPTMTQTTETVARLIAAIVTDPTRLGVTESVDRDLRIEIVTWRADQPRIVGKGGKTIRALQAIAAAMGKPDAAVSLKLREPQESGVFKPLPAKDIPSMMRDVLNQMDTMKGADVNAAPGNDHDLVLHVASERFVPAGVSDALSLVFHAIGARQDKRVTIEWSTKEAAAVA